MHNLSMPNDGGKGVFHEYFRLNIKYIIKNKNKMTNTSEVK